MPENTIYYNGIRYVKDGQKSAPLNLSNIEYIPYATWQNMTDAEKAETGVVIVTGYPEDDVQEINTGIEGLFAYKIGRLVSLHCNSAGYVNADANEEFWTLPSSLAPIDIVQFPNSYNSSQRIQIGVDSPTGVRCTTALSNAFLRFSCTYISAN